MLLEEAAGIRGLHSRRHEAELRLRGAENNLERLDDILITLDSQMNAFEETGPPSDALQKPIGFNPHRRSNTVLHSLDYGRIGNWKRSALFCPRSRKKSLRSR